MTEKYINLVCESHSWRGKWQNLKIVWTFVPVEGLINRQLFGQLCSGLVGKSANKQFLFALIYTSLIPNPIPATHNIAWVFHRKGDIMQTEGYFNYKYSGKKMCSYKTVPFKPQGTAGLLLIFACGTPSLIEHISGM